MNRNPLVKYRDLLLIGCCMRKQRLNAVNAGVLFATVGCFFPYTSFSGELEHPSANVEQQTVQIITDKTKISDIVSNPMFDGFSQFIFPMELPMEISGSISDLTLNNIDALLPYHSYIHTQSTIDVISYFQSQEQQGNKIFYDIYTKDEKARVPQKRNTGLFFFKGKPNAPFAIICAGGGFSYVGSIHESMPLALELSNKGYNVFAIQYRTGGLKVATEDLAAGINFVFTHADALQISTDNYSLWGGSAGARMAAYLGSYGTSVFGYPSFPRPVSIIMQYTSYNDYTANDPATFAVVGNDDWIANWKTMQNRINNLNRQGTTTEFHHYPNLGHGFGLGLGTSAEGWSELATAFWERQMK